MAPAHRHLGDPPAVRLGAQQHLGVEAEARGAQRHEAGLRGFGGEHLEAALAVVDAAQHEELEELVVGAAHQLAALLLVHVDARLGERPRGDGHLGVPMQVLAQLGQLVEWGAEVGVAEEAVVTPGGQHALAHRGALAAIAVEAPDLELGPILGQGEAGGVGVVAAAVVDDDHLVLLPRRVEVLAHAPEAAGQATRLVVRRHHDAEHGA